MPSSDKKRKDLVSLLFNEKNYILIVLNKKSPKKYYFFSETAWKPVPIIKYRWICIGGGYMNVCIYACNYMYIHIQGVTEMQVQNWTIPIKTINKIFHKNDKKRLIFEIQ